MNTQTQPKIIGLGFGLAIINDAVTIVYVVPGTSASGAGLSPGIIVQKIEGFVTKGIDWAQLSGPLMC